jgi:hypothetical protein
MPGWSKRTDAIASITPTSRPPRNVSGSDAMPPTSVPASDLVSSSVKVPTFTICSGATSTPTMAERQAPRPQLKRATAPREIPWRRAASGSWATARTAVPKRVRSRNPASRAARTAAVTSTATFWYETATSRIVTERAGSSGSATTGAKP